MQLKLNPIYAALFAGAVISSAVFANNENLQDIEVNTKDELIQNDYQAVGTSAVSKGNVPLMDTPTTVNVVTQKLIEDRKPASIMEALSTVSGTMQANTLGGQFDAVLKRGFGKNRDGSIMRNGMVSGPSHNFTATTETVEVLKGPASVLYGIQDPGGIVNIVTKQPLKEAKYSISGSVGNHNLWGTQIDLSSPLAGGFAYRFIFDKQEKDYWRSFGEVKRTTYAPSLSWENDKTKITLSYEHLDYVDPLDRGAYLIADTYNTKTGKIVHNEGEGTFGGVDAYTRIDQPYNTIYGKTDNIQIKGEHRLNDQWKINASYTYIRDYYEYWQSRVTKVDVKNNTITRNVEGIRGADQRIHQFSLNTVGEFAIGDVANRIVIGLDAQRDYRDIDPRVEAVTQPTPVKLSNPTFDNEQILSVVQAKNNAQQRAHTKTLGLFVQDTAYLTDKFILSSGLRYEYYDQEFGRGGLTAAYKNNTDQHGGKFVYQLGSVYKLTPNISVYGNYAESFRPQTSIAAETSSELKPEQGKSFEIGTKYENAALSSTLSLFNIRKQNVGAIENNQTYLMGKVQSRGVEFDINGRITDKLNISASYAYTKVKALENQQERLTENLQLEGIPKHQASLWLSYDLGHFLGGDFRVGAGARYLGSWNVYNSLNNQELHTYKIPHAIVSDAFISYNTKLSDKNLSLQLNGKNLANKTYYNSTQGVSNSVVPVTLGYGREIILNAKVDF